MSEEHVPKDKPCLACNEGIPEFAFKKGGYSLYRCPSCGFLVVHPFPGDDQIRAFYNDNYQFASAEFYPKAGSRARERLEKLCNWRATHTASR
ncbi:MAG TPA: hypothetical protein VLX09_05500 [Stellaceae bacterium]|nr:hypothetical protein [Stellaceae bacterium]